MFIQRRFIVAMLLCCVTFISRGQGCSEPVSLRTDLMEHTDRVTSRGELTQLELSARGNIVEGVEVVRISNQRPTFSWALRDDRESILQSGYQVQLSTSKKFEELVWDSEEQRSATPQARYSGEPLKGSTIYYWRVKIWNNRDEQSGWSAPKAFYTAEKMAEYANGYYPLTQQDQLYVERREVAEQTTFYDFGKAAFGRVKITIDSKPVSDTLVIRLGEVITSQGRIDRKPGGSRRFREIKLPLQQGRHTYNVAITKDTRNTRPLAIHMPEYIGDVLPFRYVEITSAEQPEMVLREMVSYNFNDHSSYFHSSSDTLNAIWDLCKYSIKATSFAGYYVDGDRERIPYEADVYINQLSHYAVDSEYTLGRRTMDRLIFSPTWPTEWILTTVLLAWIDYQHTGNADFINNYYTELQKKVFTILTEDNKLISTRTGKLTKEVIAGVNFAKREKMRDIVDWPQKGTLGLSGDDSGETDGFVFTDYNTVVNAYHNKALQVMSEMALAIGKVEDSKYYAQRAAEHRKAFNKLLFDPKKGYYNDGITTDHSSLHANMFALGFGLVPDKYVKSVTEFVKSRGMACSVYGSQHLLNAIYEGENADYGLKLLLASDDRGWAHAIYNIGTTITLEAWDNKYKPNQDWNHAWGAAPANIIPMQLMGVQPLSAGFERFRIKPQPGELRSATLKYPTIRGSVEVAFENGGDSFEMKVTIPPNTQAEIWIPNRSNSNKSVWVNSKKVDSKKVRGFICLNGALGSGSYNIELK